VLYQAAKDGYSWVRKYVRSTTILNDFKEPDDFLDKTTKQVNVSLDQLQKEIARLDLHMTHLESRRVIWLRLLSILFGVLLCSTLEINAFLQMDQVMPRSLSKLLQEPLMFVSSSGILLTGVGAGMGAPFWHDFIDSLRAAKDKFTK